MSYTFNITAGTGTEEVLKGTYTLSLYSKGYGTTLYDSSSMTTTVTSATVTDEIKEFTYYVKGSSDAVVRLENTGGSVISDLNGVKFRRSNAGAAPFYGQIYESVGGTVTFQYLPSHITNSTIDGPDISITIDTNTLPTGYSLVTPTENTITKKLNPLDTSKNVFVFVLNVPDLPVEATVHVYDGNAGEYATITDTTTPTRYFGIEGEVTLQ